MDHDSRSVRYSWPECVRIPARPGWRNYPRFSLTISFWFCLTRWPYVDTNDCVQPLQSAIALELTLTASHVSLPVIPHRLFSVPGRFSDTTPEENVPGQNSRLRALSRSWKGSEGLSCGFISVERRQIYRGIEEELWPNLSAWAPNTELRPFILNSLIFISLLR